MITMLLLIITFYGKMFDSNLNKLQYNVQLSEKFKGPICTVKCYP